MEPKYDLQAMLKEIEEDERAAPVTARKMTQNEIRERVKRQRQEEDRGGQS